MNRIERRFEELKEKNKKAFVVFITCGDPNLNTTRKLLIEFDRIGVSLIELGIPFSDPLADGPVIQRASERALRNRINPKVGFNLVKGIRDKINTPICLLTYYNLIFCYPQKLFLKEAKDSGIDGLIIPDLPPEEGKDLIREAERLNLDTIFFLSPTSNLKRIKFVSEISKGFIYYVCLTGVTGERKELPKDLTINIQRIKRFTKKPVLVGFGISKKWQVKEVSKISDGVIIGSAIIKRIEKSLGRSDLEDKIISFTKRLMI